ncbi:sulfatase-like hydrolase/transferase [Anaerobaca lacustris]|uniref:Sulfatase-like hydrolase/transferase n=1 Tax=Anaerobaca lacustris TaxID=3044600 RepID=A0AAW6TW03_9BACT|nr:sulfatase-like hydrolase/transferase [Sedimentisphaerales bacterium M17dextr]
MTESRRDFLRRLGSSAAGVVLGGCATDGPPARKTRPNIVFILLDDMGWSDLACYGNTFHETPNIDHLARQGMRFTDAYAACPVCSPTRASIMAGQYPARVGVTDFIPGHWRPYETLRVPTNRTQYLPLEIVTIAESLQAAGYATGHVGKWHLGGADHGPQVQGFDFVRLGGQNRTDKQVTTFTDSAIEFIETHSDGPFFLHLSHHTVHIPLEAPQDLVEKYENKPKPATGVNNPVYAAMIEHVDTNVGRVLARLDELNLSNDTIVIFFSDNGGLRQMYTGEGPIVTTNAPLRDEKGALYEGGIRVPLIVRWPGVVRPRRVCRTPVTSVDFYPTLLEIAGAERPAGQVLDGRSLLPLLQQTGRFEDRALYWHYPHYHHSTPAGAIRQGDWKLIESFENSNSQLYNLRDDIAEQTDLSAKFPRKALELQTKLALWRRSVGAAMPQINPDFDPTRREEWGRHPDRR